MARPEVEDGKIGRRTTEGIVFVNPLRVLPKRCFRTFAVMTMNTGTLVRWLVVAVALLAIAIVLIASLSMVNREYECSLCHSHGTATVATLFKHPLRTSRIRSVTPVISLTVCDHVWRPFGLRNLGMSTEEEIREAAANQAFQAIGAPGAPQPER